MATKTKSTKTATPKGPTWKIGLFRNDSGKLCTVYVRADGSVMPYEEKRVGGREIVMHRQYSGMKYSEARQKLLAEAKGAGLTDEPVESAKAPAETPKAEKSKTPAKAKKPGRAGKAPAGKSAEPAA